MQRRSKQIYFGDDGELAGSLKLADVARTVFTIAAISQPSVTDTNMSSREK